MAVGRPPKPNEQKRRLGNPGKRSLPAIATVTPLRPAQEAAPAHLGPEGHDLWERVARAAVWLAPSDLPMLALLCELTDRRAEFLANLDSSGPVLVNPSGRVVANPIVGMLSSVEKQIVEISSLLGLTPADRTRMGVAEVKATNSFEEMLARRQKRQDEEK